jgi:hypothetical protein
MFDKLKKGLKKLGKNEKLKGMAKAGLKAGVDFAKTDEGKSLLKKGLSGATGGASDILQNEKLKKLAKENLEKLKDKE